jgi:NADPH-dependent 7-cyano-7-deazaguanine reductase QueF
MTTQITINSTESEIKNWFLAQMKWTNPDFAQQLVATGFTSVFKVTGNTDFCLKAIEDCMPLFLEEIKKLVK